jgi:cytochrome c biogenesis protein
VQKLFLFFKSVKLAVVVLIFIAVTSILATLVPQGRDLAFYYHTYSPIVASLIVNSGFDNFFRSFLFILAAILFFLNLGVCAVDRLVRELKGKRRKRFGPDMIHVGMLILVVGSLVTFIGRKEGSTFLAIGDEINLPGGYLLHLENFEFFTYEDGKPKDWISTVDVFKDGELIVDSYEIEVNRPLNVGRIDVFQSSYGEEGRVYLTDPAGRQEIVKQGGRFETDQATYVFSGIFADPDAAGQSAAYFQRSVNSVNSSIVKRTVEDSIDGWTVGDFGVFNVTGLQAVMDPGFVPALVGLILAGIGLAVTYLQKIGDKEI